MKQYWRSIEEKRQEPEVIEQMHHEFPEKLPVGKLTSVTGDVDTTNKSGRRDFLKMLGFSVSAAAIAASCEIPIRRSIPYTIKPEEVTPGIPNYYATSYTRGGDFCSVLVKTREGRPILIEGNKHSSISQGGTHALAQGALLNLYDGARYKQPMMDGEPSSWEAVNSEVAGKLSSANNVVLLTSTIISPSTKAAIEAFGTKYSGFRHVMYDAISYDGMLTANEKTFGIRALPSYHFDKAEVIVGIGADFLGTWVSPVEFAADYAKTRRVSKDHTVMSKHYQIESLPTLAGSKADVRIPVQAAEEPLAAIELFNQIAGGGSSGYAVPELKEVADALKAARGKSLVVCDTNDANVQMVVNAINHELGNYGNTLDINTPCFMRQGSDAELNKLVNDLTSGNVDVLMMAECNPVYDLPNGTAFASAMEKATTIAFAERKDETSAGCKFVCPTNHFLESWGDAMPISGVFATTQPTIEPLYDTKQYQEVLLNWAGQDVSYYDFVQDYWKTGVLSAQSKYSTFTTLWNNTVHDGEVVGKGDVIQLEANWSGLTGAVNTAAATFKSANSGNQIKLYSKVSIGDGHLSDNPWLQELPDPVTRATWDNYLIANPTWADENGLTPDLKSRKHKTVRVSQGDASVTLPVVVVPGLPSGSFAMAYGYGRTSSQYEELNRGENVYPFLSAQAGSKGALLSDVSIEPTGDSIYMALVQLHHNIKYQGLGGEKTRLVVKETTLEEYKENPEAGNVIGSGELNQPRSKWIAHHLKTIYPDHKTPGHHWGMVIDLNTCTGCAACVIACHTENNVPVVGKEEVRRAHEMHWLRIDRYYSGDEENPNVTFQPMLCQHCDNAPCENVCPVAATNHSSEGINQMAYNRCIGTRYCANNCPYKVRRFNWLDYTGADSFYAGTIIDNDKEVAGLHGEMERMVLNPDVTVRSRGVMEKCSFCVQRIQVGKLEAKKEDRQLKDSDIVTACQSACPTDAITFGDMNNPESAVAGKMKDERAFGVIEEIHTLPSVNYLVQVRNVKPEKKAEQTSDDNA